MAAHRGLLRQLPAEIAVTLATPPEHVSAVSSWLDRQHQGRHAVVAAGGYLHVATNHGVVVGYRDEAVAVLSEDGRGGGAFVSATLRPIVTVADASMAGLARTLHAEAAEKCFIAASVAFPVGHEASCVAKCGAQTAVGSLAATSSAICTAFSAAPLRRLSFEMKSTRPLPSGADWSWRMRPT